MNLLLDTHAFLWWMVGDDKLSMAAAEAIRSATVVHVSAATAWEIATKARLGKLHGFGHIAADLTGSLLAHGFPPRPISFEAGTLAGTLAHDHRDPFDRMLIAQAKIDRLQLVSNERLFDTFSVERLW
ncbi:type II toxin-antitoxin system VapC family toxin [Methyloraptor flagellatus]|uniref:Type II toxin-antitoxin system VapC family toxin n=1 Tax=Methyloraptor flagellatus TaxID=3162530 RepID=A0AAU7XAY7_9HYPH